MLFRYISIKSSNRKIIEEIKRDLILSLEKRGISVSRVTIDMNSNALSISVYMNDKVCNAV